MTPPLAPSVIYTGNEIRFTIHTNLGPLTVPLDVMGAMLTLRELTVALHRAIAAQTSPITQPAPPSRRRKKET